MLMTTTDTLPQPYTIIGPVYKAFASRAATSLHFKASTGVEEKLDHMMGKLAEKAQGLGADAVIGVHLAHIFGDNQVLMGTAVKLG